MNARSNLVAAVAICWTIVLAASCAKRKQSDASDELRVWAHAARSHDGLVLTLAVGPASIHSGMDDVTYTDARLPDLVVRANGERLTPSSIKVVPTLSGCDVVIALPPSIAPVLELGGHVAILNTDHTELDRVALPARVRIDESAPP
ncbi:MAG: hypothetical protein ACTHU0_32290 [Kofleriaceae bacterium]